MSALTAAQMLRRGDLPHPGEHVVIHPPGGTAPHPLPPPDTQPESETPNMPASTRPKVTTVNTMWVTADDVQIRHAPDFAWVDVGGIVALFPSSTMTVPGDLERIRDIGARIVSEATAELERVQPSGPNRDGHTHLDYHALVAAGVDPTSTQPREHAVNCVWCLKPTFNQGGGCDSPDHYTPPRAADVGANA